jgi:geranylgeranyl pyrophosphate synthase
MIAALPCIEKYQKRIEDFMSEDLAVATCKHPGLHRMCTYVTSGGKKIRSIILLSLCDSASRAALAVEYLHAASLILDDIADADNYRRGRKAVHKVFGIGKAQMCALYLIGHAGKLLQESAASGSNEFKLFIYDNLFANLRMLIEGQYEDISNSTDSADGTDGILHKKTGTMFEIPFVLGWSMANMSVPNPGTLSSLQACARSFGQMFQVADDFEDVQKDSRSGARYNYVINHGKHAANEHFTSHLKKFSAEAQRVGVYTDELQEATMYLYKKVQTHM